MYDLIIIGGGPAGLSAAVYARRANKSVLILEKNAFGGQITFSPKVENYPAFETISGSELADQVKELVSLEKEFESLVAYRSCSCDACRSEGLAIFQVDGLSILRKGVGAVEALTLRSCCKCIVFVECEAESAALESSLGNIFIKRLFHLGRYDTGSSCLYQILAFQSDC